MIYYVLLQQRGEEGEQGGFDGGTGKEEGGQEA
jgi:hypothetical protein